MTLNQCIKFILCNIVVKGWKQEMGIISPHAQGQERLALNDLIAVSHDIQMLTFFLLEGTQVGYPGG